jgi:cystathionine gamma-lyase
MQDATRVVRAGLPPAEQGEPFAQGPVFASAFHAAGDPASVPYYYGRDHNPTWTAYERALGELEGGDALVFASGMAATMALLGAVLRRGDMIVMPTDSYYTARRLVDDYFAGIGVEVRRTQTVGDSHAQLLRGARLLWLESPTNPGLDVCDIRRLSSAAHDAGALVAVDNTTATPLGQRPLALGADFSVASDTKALTGHADLVLGHVATRDRQWHDALKMWRSRTGAIAGPMEVWLALRSLTTLHVRLERQCDNAMDVARYLESHPRVESVRYPGLSNDPSYELARKQMQRFGPVVSFTLRTREQAERFLASCTLVTEATSFGGVHTSAERRARWGGDVVPEGFIRMSVGCEAIEDLIADIAQALGA